MKQPKNDVEKNLSKDDCGNCLNQSGDDQNQDKHNHNNEVLDNNHEVLDHNHEGLDQNHTGHAQNHSRHGYNDKHSHKKSKYMSTSTILIIVDIIQSIGVVIASQIILYEPSWKIADPICTILSVFLVVISRF